MENHCSSTNFIWHGLNGTRWLKILSIPTLSWAKPFISFAGLPEIFIEESSIWDAIYSQMKVEVGNPTPMSIRVGDDREYGEKVRENVKKALEQLAEQADSESAILLEKWVWCHFFCKAFALSMSRWSHVLSYTYPSQEPKRVAKQIEPPLVLSAVLPDIFHLVAPFQIRHIRDEMRNSAPPPDYEQIPYERLEKCFESTLLSQAIFQGMPFQALQIIAQRLSFEERLEVVAWAELQLKASRFYSSEDDIAKLYGGEYLQTELPCSTSLQKRRKL
jgi:hypothetical protein